LLTALQIPTVARTHLHALEVASEDLSEILPAIDDVSRQMIQPGPGGISQVDWEELDDEEIIVHSTHFACEAIILQQDAGVSFAIVLDDVAWHSKKLWEASIAHDTSKCLWARPFRAEAASFMVIKAPVALEVLTERLVGSTGHRLKSLPVRKLFPPLEPLEKSFVPRP
jgi:hypothetical protein